MKKIITILLLFISLQSFSQMRYVEEVDLFKERKIDLNLQSIKLKGRTSTLNAAPVLLCLSAGAIILGFSSYDSYNNLRITGKETVMPNSSKAFFIVGALSFTIGTILEIKK